MMAGAGDGQSIFMTVLKLTYLFIITTALSQCPSNVYAQTTTQCGTIGHDLQTEQARLTNLRFYLNTQNPAPCSGNVTTWQYCYYQPDVAASIDYEAAFAVYRLEGSSYQRVSDTFLINIQVGNIGSSLFTCQTFYTAVVTIQQDDIVGACVHDALLGSGILNGVRAHLNLAGSAPGYTIHSADSSICDVLGFPTFSLLAPDNVARTQLTPRSSTVLHLYANIESELTATTVPISTQQTTTMMSTTDATTSTPTTTQTTTAEPTTIVPSTALTTTQTESTSLIPLTEAVTTQTEPITITPSTESANTQTELPSTERATGTELTEYFSTFSEATSATTIVVIAGTVAGVLGIVLLSCIATIITVFCVWRAKKSLKNLHAANMDTDIRLEQNEAYTLKKDLSFVAAAHADTQSDIKLEQNEAYFSKKGLSIATVHNEAYGKTTNTGTGDTQGENAAVVMQDNKAYISTDLDTPNDAYDYVDTIPNDPHDYVDVC